MDLVLEFPFGLVVAHGSVKDALILSHGARRLGRPLTKQLRKKYTMNLKTIGAAV